MWHVLVVCPLYSASGFFGHIQHSQQHHIQRQRLEGLKLWAADAKNEYNVEAASVQLTWERIQSSNSRPILNLSSLSASLEESKEERNIESPELWGQGQRWMRTKEGLEKLEIEADNSWLQSCPQLLRLDPLMVLETAEWIANEFGIDYLKSQPRLLSYSVQDVEYGLQFMTMMMMTDAKPVCRASSDFFLSAIDGGIQEQAVEVALGAAADATSKASQTIIGDAMTSLKTLRKRKGPP